MLSEKIKEDFIEVENLPEDIIIDGTYIIKQHNPNTHTHGFFKYPCKFIPEIPKWAIKKYTDSSSLIFDPFSGSGTTLLQAQLMGHDAVGTEIDPIAIKLIQAKTAKYSEEDFQNIQFEYSKLVKKVKEESEVFVPDIRNLDHWFIEENAKELGKLRVLIDEISHTVTKNFLEIVFLSIIKSVSQADDTSPKPYVSSRVPKVAPKVFDKFSKTYKRYLTMLKEYVEAEPINNVEIVDGDALNTKSSFLADLAVTSPPYINAFDYPRTLRLENLWMSTHTEASLLESKNDYVGTERFNLNEERRKKSTILSDSSLLNELFLSIKEVDEKRAYVVRKFFEDMKVNLKNVYNHLKENGYYVIVIGDSNIRKHHIESWKIINDIAERMGFEYVEHFAYNIQNPYIRIPRSGRGGKIKKDYVLVIRK